MTATQALTDDVLAVFRLACEQEQYVVADLLLSALEAMAGQGQDSGQLDAAYLVVANCCAPASRCDASDAAQPPLAATSMSISTGGALADTARHRRRPRYRLVRDRR